MSALRLFHTVRWLKVGQIAGQLRQRLRRILPAAFQKIPRFAPGEASVGWQPAREDLGKGVPRHDAQTLLGGTARFLNTPHSVGFPPSWQLDQLPKLWRYNLHYFEYLWSLPFEDSRRAALDWINHHKPGRGQVGWEPYPLSLRLQNWIGYFLGLHLDKTVADGDFQEQLLASVVQQTAFLEKNIEYHLLGNHLLENALALTTAGASLDSRRSNVWLETGLGLLRRQLQEQVLPDGCHFERSPMYQSRLVYALGQLSASGHARIEEVTGQAREALRTSLGLLVHPDGDIALLNDAALGIAPRPNELGVVPAASGTFALPNAGYFGSRSGGDYVVCDAGPIGPDYLPGHAHGDIFSFELSLGETRVIVDSGVFDYEIGQMRAYCRSTKAHNTVEIEGTDQSEFWGAFRVGRRAKPNEVTFAPAANGFRLSGSHDGYLRLRGKPVHKRIFSWQDRGVLTVEDRVESTHSVKATSRLHLHPECQIVDLNERVVTVQSPSERFVVAWQGEGHLETEDAWYCPEFGLRQHNTALAFHTVAPSQTRFCVARDLDSVSFEV